MKTQLNPSADGRTGPNSSNQSGGARCTPPRSSSSKNSENTRSSQYDNETEHFYCDHDFSFKMLGGRLCKSCGVGETENSVGIKSSLLVSKLNGNSLHHDNLPNASLNFLQIHNKRYLN